MISKSEFVARIEKLPDTIVSKTGIAAYTDFRLEGDILLFKRANTGKFWRLNLNQLYDAYKANEFINTSVIKNVTKGRVNSPSIAILMTIRCIDKNGIRI